MANVEDGFSGKHNFLSRKWGEIKKGYSHFKNGDIGIAKISPCFENLKSCIFVSLPNGVGAGTTELVILRGLCINVWFYLYLLKSAWYISQGTIYFKGVVGQQRVNSEIFKDLIVPLPPIDEQERIVKQIQRFFSLIDTIEDGKYDLNLLVNKAKNKILDLAIHGKLVPQDPADEPAIELLKRVNPSAEITCDNEHYWNMPRGWVICNFNQIFKTVSSKQFQIQQSEILTTGKTPVISQSSLFIEGYSNETNICKYHPCIIFGDHTRNVKYIDFEFIVGADGVKILMPEFNPKYAYYLIKYATLNIENKGYSRHFGQISKFKFPLPPLAEQQRIVAKIEELFAQLDAIENSLQA